MLSKEQRYRMENGLGAMGDSEMDWEALKKVEEEIRKEPDNFRHWAARGILYFNEDCETAIQSFSRAIALCPFDGNAYYSRGRKYSSQRKYPQAAADFIMATRLNPLDPEKWHYLGTIYFYCGRFYEAEGCFRKALAVSWGREDEDTPPEFDWLWLSCMFQGKKAEAGACLEDFHADTRVHPADMAYKRRVMLYKGLTPLEEYLAGIKGGGPGVVTEKFGAAAYCYFVLEDPQKAVDLLDEVLSCPEGKGTCAYRMAGLYRDDWAQNAASGKNGKERAR